MQKKISILVILCCCLIFQYFIFSEDKAAEAIPGFEHTLSLSRRLIIPLSAFANFYDYGYGTCLEYTMHHVFINNLGLAVFLADYSINSLNPGENSLLSLPLTLFIGYDFPLPGRYTITPCLGFGYILHMVSNVETRDFYFNPELSLKCRTGYQYNDAIELFIAQGYTIYFEQGNAGQYFSFDIGINLLLQ